MRYFYTPLETYKGYNLEEIKSLIKERDVYIWGGGFLGRSIKRCFERNGLLIKAFCDSDSKLKGTKIDNIEVISPYKVLDNITNKNIFIIIASMRHRKEIEEECIKAGLKKEEDFISCIKISRPEVAIDVTDIFNCNIIGNNAYTKNNYMAASTYEQVLNKLISEIPSLISVNISNMCEPLINPEIDKIIEITEKLFPCTVTTELQDSAKLEEIVKAQPSQLVITLHGYGNSYEINQPGKSWQIFYDNLHYLKELVEKHKPKTLITISYNIYRNNQGQDLENIKNLSRKLRFRLNITWGYLNPYDKILNFCEGQHLDNQSKNLLNNLAWNFYKTLELIKLEAYNPCLCQRIFPIINSDLSVSLCHVYQHPMICKNFLEMPLNEIIKLRHSQSQCITCQKHGIHRLDIEVLIKKFPNENILIQYFGG